MYQGAKLAWRADETPAEIAAALRALAVEYPIAEGGRGLKMRFVPVRDGDTVSRVDRNRGGVTIEYSNLAGALRGVGSAMAKLDGMEKTPFTTLGIMLDLSRNMVMRVEHPPSGGSGRSRS